MGTNNKQPTFAGMEKIHDLPEVEIWKPPAPKNEKERILYLRETGQICWNCKNEIKEEWHDTKKAKWLGWGNRFICQECWEKDDE